jgi:hypothetical protein
MVNRDFRDLLAAFSAHDVRFLVVGAYAVTFHTRPRFTKDLDVWVEPTAENAIRVVRALAECRGSDRQQAQGRQAAGSRRRARTRTGTTAMTRAAGYFAAAAVFS